MSELKPCPFCGDSAFFYPDGDTEGHSVMCRGVADPSCASNTFGYSTEAEAIAAWNRRAQPAAPAILMSAVFVKEGADDFAPQRLLPCGSAVYLVPPDAAPSVAPEPVAWTLQSELDAAQTTCSAHLWFTNPRNSAWTALFTREQIAAHPPRAPLTEEIESADNLLRHLGLDPERCRTVGGSLNVSRIKTLLADAAPTARESAME